MISFTNLPDGVHGTERVFSPIDMVSIHGSCPSEDCDFDGDVDAEAWLLGTTHWDRTFEYRWVCPWCETEVVEERCDSDQEWS